MCVVIHSGVQLAVPKINLPPITLGSERIGMPDVRGSERIGMPDVRGSERIGMPDVRAVRESVCLMYGQCQTVGADHGELS